MGRQLALTTMENDAILGNQLLFYSVNCKKESQNMLILAFEVIIQYLLDFFGTFWSDISAL